MSAERMTTYKRADGELISGEYGWVGDIEYFDDDEHYTPVEIVEEVWERTASRTFWRFPPLYTCEADDDCDEDSVVWKQRGESWVQACDKHREPA